MELRRVGAARFLTRVERPPVWTLLVAASFCGYFTLFIYCDLVRPVNPGYRADATAAGVTLTEVRPGTPAAAAGMTVGDRLIAINGLTIVDSDSGAIGANYLIGVPMPVIVERQGSRYEMTMLLPRRSSAYWSTWPGASLLVMRLAQLVCIIAGVTVALRRPRDLDALAASWLLMTCGVFLISLPGRLPIVWRHLPFPSRELLWIPYVSSITIGPILLTFVSLFPRRLPSAGYIQAAAWALAAVALASPLYNAIQLVYEGVELRTIGPKSVPLLLVTSVCLIASVFLIVINYRRIDDVHEKRRLRVVVTGISVGVLPGFSALTYFWLTRETNQATSIFESRWMVVVAVTLLAAPLSITYAVLRHQLFDLNFTMRKWLQYTLARGLVLSIVPGMSSFMIVDVLLQSDQTVNDILAQRSVLYLFLTAVALLVFANRRRWLKAIDRRFFRERMSAYDVLRDVAEQVRRAGSLDRVAPVVVARLESSEIHPEFAALLVLDPATRAFRTIAAAPSAAGPLDLRDDSKLVALARVVEQPFDTSTRTGQSLLRQLSPADRDYLYRARIEALIRIVTPDDQLHAFLALGPKRSQEPYAEWDYGVLVTIAEIFGLLAAHSPAPTGGPALEECPECGACFDEGTAVCTTHARPLVGRELPRTLRGRYRLDRRLAAGGMGTVYDALDLALDRHVAAKVVREHLTASEGALERFVAEAKLAARLRDHPNVVTVYDYGAIDKRQPFLIMELLDGRNLRQALEDDGRIAPQRALLILEDVCSAVSYAHGHKLIHRDLKPENIFLVENGRREIAKVLDFGIAKPLSVATTIDGRWETGSRILLGTLEYMSPEQRRGAPPSKAWDLWSLAVVALEMLSGRPPVSALLPDLGPWQPGNVLRDTFPDCVGVFNRALAINAADRPDDADTLCREITAGLR